MLLHQALHRHHPPQRRHQVRVMLQRLDKLLLFVAAQLAISVRAAVSLRGRNPTKSRRSEGRPDALAKVSIALAPGMAMIGYPAWRAANVMR